MTRLAMVRPFQIRTAGLDPIQVAALLCRLLVRCGIGSFPSHRLIQEFGIVESGAGSPITHASRLPNCQKGSLSVC